MSYLDPDARRIQPAGLIVSTLLNGAAITAIMMSAYTITPKSPDFIPEISWIRSEPEPAPPAKAAKLEKHEIARAIPERTVHQGPITQTPPLTGPIGGSDDGGFIPPLTEADPPAPMTQERMPILKIARPDLHFASALQPTYPPSMIRAEREGTVKLRVLVGTDGRVRQVEVVSSADEAFATVTRDQALKRWRFIPATSDGNPIESWREMTVVFRLPD